MNAPDAFASSEATEIVLAARGNPQGELRVVFRRVGDRWRHALYGPGGELLLASSVEGSPEEDWPPSPPLQSLSLETIDGRPVALGVGMAGTSHWSLSVEPVAGAAAVVFDWACRVDRPPAWLGNTYEAGPAVRVTPLEVSGQAAGRCHRTGDWITLLAPAAPHAGRTTVRWKYRVEV